MTRTYIDAVFRLLRPGLIVTLCGLLSACGQKGPLFLPEPAQAEIGQAAAQTGEEQQQAEDDESHES